jgi:hypothetical protein
MQVVPLAPVLNGSASPAFIRKTLCRNFGRKALNIFNLMVDRKVVESDVKITKMISDKQKNKQTNLIFIFSVQLY